MPNLQGAAPPEKREGRALLTVRDPQVERLLAGLEIDGSSIPEARRFGKALAAAITRWRVGREVLATTPARLDKGRANRLLRLELARLAREGGDG